MQANIDIVSIVSDCRREKFPDQKLSPTNYNMDVDLRYKLRYFAKKYHKTVVYAGCKIATTSELYLSTSFIEHCGSAPVEVNPHFLGNGEVITRFCALQKTRRENKRDEEPPM